MVEKVQIAAAALHLSLQFVLGAFLSSSRESQTKNSTSTVSIGEKYLSEDKSIDVNFEKKNTYMTKLSNFRLFWLFLEASDEESSGYQSIQYDNKIKLLFLIFPLFFESRLQLERDEHKKNHGELQKKLPKLQIKGHLSIPIHMYGHMQKSC